MIQLIVCCIDIVFPAKYDVTPVQRQKTAEQASDSGKLSPGGGDVQDGEEVRKRNTASGEESSDKLAEQPAEEDKKDI